MRPHSNPSNRRHRRRYLLIRAGAALALVVFFLVGPSASAGSAKITGLQFSVGQPAAQPAAKVTIAEVGQGSQKKGFLRIALLPLVQARGVDVRMQRPDFSALSEIQNTLQGISKMDAQEFLDVRLFSGGEPVPILLAEEASPGPNLWHLKKARIRRGDGIVGISECVFHLSGPKAGMCIDEKGGVEVRVELSGAQSPR